MPPETLTVVCPHCRRGSVTGPNGESQRCAMCGGRGRLAAPAAELAPFDPRDGALLGDLAEVETGLLAHVALELKRREAQLAQSRRDVEAELAARLQAGGRRVVLVDDLELRIDTGRSRAWDAEDLEATLRELVDSGVLHAGELTGIITHEVKVDGRRMQQLLGQLDGRAALALEACFRWESKGRPRLTITPSQALLAEDRD